MKKLDFGLSWGILFAVLSISFGLILNRTVASQLNSLAQTFSYSTLDFSFYLGLSCLILAILFYLITAFFNRKKIENALLILFSISLIFLNTSLFYYFYGDKSDGQLIFEFWTIPFKSAILYPLIGAFHDAFFKPLRIDGKMD